MRRALILGGTGLIGRAAANRQLAGGWQVDVTGRDARHLPPALANAGASYIQADRADGPALAAALGGGAELLVDCVCYTASDAMQLLPLARAAACTVMISSTAVYADAAGGYVAAGNYAQTVAAEADWLVSAAGTAEDHAALPWLQDGYFDAMFDYAAEDRYLAAMAAAAASSSCRPG